MATSEVKRIIEPDEPQFEIGNIVFHKTFGPVLVSNRGNSIIFRGVKLTGNLIGENTDLTKDQCRPFKGSVTLTEG